MSSVNFAGISILGSQCSELPVSKRIDCKSRSEFTQELVFFDRLPEYQLKMHQPSSAAGKVPFFPVEVLAVILRNLDLAERKILRLVSRHFRDAVDYILSDELVIANSVYASHRWYNTNEFADHCCFARALNTEHVNQGVLKSILIRLQRFKCNQPISAAELVALVEHPRQLKHLELNEITFDDPSKSINVPHLEVLVIRSAIFKDRSPEPDAEEFTYRPRWVQRRRLTDQLEEQMEKQTLKFISKQLHTVCFGDHAMKRVELSDYSLVKHLEFENAAPQLPLYVNVTKVLCSGLLNLDSSRITELVRLKNIEELHLFNHHQNLNERPSDKVNACLGCTFDFLNKCAEFDDTEPNPQLVIYIQGIRFEPGQEAPDYRNPNFFQVHYENREKLLAPFHQFTTATLDQEFWNFVRNKQQFQVELETCTYFRRHFPYIEIVNIHPKMPANLALSFLRNFDHINVLSIRHPGYEQEFYDQLTSLPGLVASLNELFLFEEDNIEIGDLTFLDKFERLHKVHSNMVPLESALWLIDLLPCPGYVDLTLPETGLHMIEMQKFRARDGEIRYNLKTSEVLLLGDRKTELQHNEPISNISFEDLKKRVGARE